MSMNEQGGSSFGGDWPSGHELGMPSLGLERVVELVKIQHMFEIAAGADAGLNALTNKFLVEFGMTHKYPFPHDRIRLIPKNRTPETGIGPVTVRKPYNNPEDLFLTFGAVDYLLTRDAFSVVDLTRAFVEAGADQLVSPDSLTSASNEDIANLIIVRERFEPGLQNNDPSDVTN